MLAGVWSALGGAVEDVGSLEVRRDRPVLASTLAVEELLVASAGAALLAAAELGRARTGRAPAVALDVDRLAVAASSERYVRLDGAPVGEAFNRLSAFLPARDGWVRLHGNYPWHRDALFRALGVVSAEEVPPAVAKRDALDVEEAVVAAGGCAAAARDAATWAATEQGRAAAAHGLVARDRGPEGGRPLPNAALPAAGLRVLDFTRVIAGPVGTRMLAALGAEVVRVEWPDRPEMPLLALEGGLGKRWLPLDLRDPEARARLERELAAADVVVAGYRPGALDAFGLHPDALADRHPHLVCVTLSAWGDAGPWGQRRGFDSLVQVATGIAETVAPGTPESPPGALPVQALDHATGYLVAAAALRGLTTRARTGRADRARLALAATAHALLAEGTRPLPDAPEVDPEPHLVELDHPSGRLRVALPPGTLDGRPLAWPAVRG
jgi:hypothetical protein